MDTSKLDFDASAYKWKVGYKNLPPKSFKFQVLKSKVHDNIVDTRHIDVTNKHESNLKAIQFVQAISF
jgi:hypothetical protein